MISTLSSQLSALSSASGFPTLFQSFLFLLLVWLVIGRDIGLRAELRSLRQRNIDLRETNKALNSLLDAQQKRHQEVWRGVTPVRSEPLNSQLSTLNSAPGAVRQL